MILMDDVQILYSPVGPVHVYVSLHCNISIFVKV